ncbi:MAG: OmpH family outer membrane protein [Rhodobacteraceae bacterium]|nr:OmpH family outer membrane protein [Paracoccaceae bacterium]
MRLLAAATIAGSLASFGMTAISQQPSERLLQLDMAYRPAIAIVDFATLFDHSLFGIRLAEEIRDAQLALVSENDYYSSQFEIEEGALAAQRESMSEEDFTVMAEEFDRRVEERREIQDGKEAILETWRRQQISRFQQIASQTIARLAEVLGVQIVLPGSSVIWFAEEANITEIALTEIDRIVSDGTAMQSYVPATSFAGILTEAERLSESAGEVSSQ